MQTNQDKFDSILFHAVNVVSRDDITRILGDQPTSQAALDEAMSSFRYRIDLSDGTSSAKTDSLFDHLCEATERVVAPSQHPILLLSSGKDSVAIALSLAELGYFVDCISVVSTDEERLWIQGLCDHLGHRVQFFDGQDFSKFLSTSSYRDLKFEKLNLDQAIVTIKAALSKIETSGRQLIDGLGSDGYFGYLPSTNQLRSLKLGAYLRPFGFVSSQSYFFRSWSGANGLATSLRYLLPRSLADEFACDISPDFGLSPDNIMNFRALIRGAIIDEHLFCEKTRLIASATGSTAVFPWTDDILANYVFNLPSTSKFDFKTLTNKIILRNFLSEKLDYRRPKRGIDLIESFSLDQLKEKKFFEGLPADFIERITKSRLPLSAKRRALIELSLLWATVEELGFGDDLCKRLNN